MAKNYDEVGVVRMLNKTNGVTITKGKKIIINPNIPIGNGNNGKIDFLRNYCGYIVDYNNSPVEKHEKSVDNIVAKHNRKIDLVSNVSRIINKRKNQ